MANGNTVMMSLDRYDALVRRLHTLESIISFERYSPSHKEVAVVFNRNVFDMLVSEKFVDYPDSSEFELLGDDELFIPDIIVAKRIFEE